MPDDLHKEFTAPSSATSGLAGYDLTDRYRPTRPGRRKSRRFGKAEDSLNHEPSEVPMSQYQEMLALLKESVSSIATADEKDREDLLNKSFAEFEEAMGGHIVEALQEAFELGMSGDLKKFYGDDDGELQKANVSQVASMATLMQSIENAIQYISVDPDGDDDLGPENRAALVAWCEAGKHILAAMVADYAGVADMVAAEEAGEPVAAEEAAKFFEARELQKQEFKAIIGLLKDRAQEMLAKADPGMMNGGAADGSAGGNGQDIGQMSEVEIIGRLAAAILVQVDQMMGPDQAAAAPDQTAADQAAASQPAVAQDNAGPAASNGAAADATQQPNAEPTEEDKKKQNPFAGKAEEAGALQKADGGGAIAKVEGAAAVEEPLAKRNKQLEEENAELRKAAGLAKAGTAPALKSVGKEADDLAKSAGSQGDLKKRAEELAVMPADKRTHELIKIAQSKPLRLVG